MDLPGIASPLHVEVLPNHQILSPTRSIKEIKMKLVRCLLIVGFCLAAGLPRVHAGEIERIQAKGELVVSLNKGYPPFSMLIDGQPAGLDVDLARLLAEYLGVKVRFIRPERYDQQIPRLLGGDSDIIIAAMTRRVERGLKVSFTDPYFEVMSWTGKPALPDKKLTPARFLKNRFIERRKALIQERRKAATPAKPLYD
jgi:hypothetical protein